jgi:hypothetical protein
MCYGICSRKKIVSTRPRVGGTLSLRPDAYGTPTSGRRKENLETKTEKRIPIPDWMRIEHFQWARRKFRDDKKIISLIFGIDIDINDRYRL